MLSEYFRKVKIWIIENKADLFTAAVIFLVGLASFGLGRLSVLWPKKEPIKLEHTELSINGEILSSVRQPKTAAAIKDKYVASKNGSAYHYPWCPGAQKIKETNKIWFISKEEAERAGYKPAGNCPGL